MHSCSPLRSNSESGIEDEDRSLSEDFISLRRSSSSCGSSAHFEAGSGRSDKSADLSPLERKIPLAFLSNESRRSTDSRIRFLLDVTTGFGAGGTFSRASAKSERRGILNWWFFLGELSEEDVSLLVSDSEDREEELDERDLRLLGDRFSTDGSESDILWLPELGKNKCMQNISILFKGIMRVSRKL